ncbi:DnaJ C-terminal domain-containing protein [Roseovarius salis]|uniref:DnaJ C-terminal domain-containing protein n=1 Tax=Roseovarius salis TaxID=3376063 RepID=UPI0037CC2D6A
MSDDPYKVLGVSKDASQDEIKKAYRKKAKALHPDLHPGDKAKQDEFKKVGAAYDIIGDAEKRRRFDAGEIDASGQERPERQYYHQYAGADPQGRYQSASGFGDFEDVSDIFADLFGGRARGGGGGFGGFGEAAGGRRAGGGAQFTARGADARYHLDVDFLDAARGAKRTLPLPDGNTIELTIPAGVREGQTLRLRGKGQPGMGGGPPGDALVEIGVRPHPLFTRDGNDIEVELPITFDEAVLGGKVEVPTITGRVTMTVPRGASSGRRLRLKGKGIRPPKGAAGDQHVRLRIVLPETVDDEMEEIAKRWRAHVRHDPRAKLGG